jgi:hypothetical protein
VAHPYANGKPRSGPVHVIRERYCVAMKDEMVQTNREGDDTAQKRQARKRDTFEPGRHERRGQARRSDGGSVMEHRMSI